MTKATRAAFLIALGGNRIGAALDADPSADEVAVPITQAEILLALRCIEDHPDDEAAPMLRAIFTRALQQLAADNN